MKKLLVAAAAILSVATASHAAIIPTLGTITAEGSLFRYSYQGTLVGDQGVINGSKLVIFDFAGFAGGMLTPANVAASTEFSSGFFAPGQTDDPNIINLVFTYTGPPFNATGGPFADTNFNGLSALSTFSGVGLDGFAAVAVKNNDGSATGTPTFNAGTVQVPAGIPEPATWGMMILGFGGVGALLRRRRESGVFA
jgi:hypothetical protein